MCAAQNGTNCRSGIISARSPVVCRPWSKGNSLMKQIQKRYLPRVLVGLSALLALGLLSIGGMSWTSQAAEEKAECCKAGDTTPPVDW